MCIDGLADPVLDFGADVDRPRPTGGVARDQMIEPPTLGRGVEAVVAPAQQLPELPATDHLRLCRLVATLIDVVAGLSARVDRVERHAPTSSGS